RRLAEPPTRTPPCFALATPARREALNWWRHLPELAERRCRLAPALGAFAASRRSSRDAPFGELDHVGLDVVGRHQWPDGLDEDVDPAARLRELLEPPLAHQQRL